MYLCMSHMGCNRLNVRHWVKKKIFNVSKKGTKLETPTKEQKPDQLMLCLSTSPSLSNSWKGREGHDLYLQTIPTRDPTQFQVFLLLWTRGPKRYFTTFCERQKPSTSLVLAIIYFLWFNKGQPCSLPGIHYTNLITKHLESIPELTSWHHHVRVAWPCARYLTFGCLLCKMGIMIAPSLGEDD